MAPRRRDSFTPGQGFLEETTNTYRPSASSASSSSSSSASRTKALTQARLFGMHKAAIITPRATSTAAPGSSSRSRTAPTNSMGLVDAFTRQTSQSTSSASKIQTSRSRRRVERAQPDARSTASGDDEDDDDDHERDEARRPNSSHHDPWRNEGRDVPSSSRHSENTISGVGQKILARSRRHSSQSHVLYPTSNTFARSILNPSSKRRGPRLSFDDDPHENDDDDEMMILGEEARRKKNRVWTGGRGQLDLVPLRDWEEDQAREEKERDKGWSSATAAVKAESKEKKSLEMLGDEENVEIRHRVQHSTQSRLERPMSASPSDPGTENDEPFPLSARSRPRTIESQPSFADSSESDAGEYLQQCLVGGRGDELVPSSSPDAEVLVCDSDEETLDRLGYQCGRGGVDDSGFAEYNDDGEEDGGCEERGDVGMILPSSQPRLDEVTTSEPEKRKAVGLERSESSILMPPPPVPVRQQARQVVKMEELPPPQARGEVCFDEIETQWAVHSPIKSRPTPTPEKIPNRPSTWSSLDAAWQGARPLTPPPPLEPRQANLLEFFHKTHEARGDEGEEDQENWIIEDSQPGSSIPLGQHEMRAFQAALTTTREIGKKKIRGGNGLGGIEEEEDIEEAEEEVHEVEVPSSDQEDGPWSPLGSPVRMRFPGSGIAKEMEMVQLDAVEEEHGKDVRGDDDAESVPEAEELGDDSMDFLPPLPSFPPSSQMSSTQRDRIKSREGSGEMEREETQWESYWTVEAVEPSPFHALMDEDEEEDENENV